MEKQLPSINPMPNFAAECAALCAHTWLGQTIFEAALRPATELWIFKPSETEETWYGVC